MRQPLFLKSTATQRLKAWVKWLVPCLFCLIALHSCNDEDDVNEIFTGKTWKLTYLGSTDDWEDLSSGVNLNNYATEKRPLKSYTVIFYEGSVRITGAENTVWTGTWSADGKNNTFHINITEKQGEGTTANEKTFLEQVAGACYYRGSAVLLRLFDSERSNFVQFGPLEF
ncbi:MAG: DUF4847 family protein [Bacteroidaceae bacterium]|jgi:hypothetical protein